MGVEAEVVDYADDAYDEGARSAEREVRGLSG